MPAGRAANQPRRLDGVRVLVLFGGSDLFGQERANIGVFDMLTEQGLKAKFVISSRWGDGEIREELERCGLEFMRAPFGFHWTRHMLGKHFGYFLLNLAGVLVTSWRIWREAKRWRATHIYTPNWLYLSYAFPGLWLSGLPLIYRVGDKPPPATSFPGRLMKWMWWRVTRAVGISEFVFSSVKQSGLSVERMSVIYSHAPSRRPVSESAILAPHSRVILFVGQIAEFKGVRLLVEAIALLAREGQDFELWLAGKPSWGDKFEENLTSRIRELGLESKVRQLGYVHDVDALFRQASIHVAPSMCEEALGNVVLEAKAGGVPSVVFPDGGLPELVAHKVDGYVCPDKTVEALAAGLRYFLNDPAACEAAGQAARHSLDEKFGVEKFRQGWTRVFLETTKV